MDKRGDMEDQPKSGCKKRQCGCSSESADQKLSAYEEQVAQRYREAIALHRVVPFQPAVLSPVTEETTSDLTKRLSEQVFPEKNN